MSAQIHELVTRLPEVYQPIYHHPDLSINVSRMSSDRVEEISRVVMAAQRKYNRPLRVLDLGCAQGFVSLSVAELGAVVHGVDYLEQNISVCRELAREFPELQVTFETETIENVVAGLERGCFDVVIGLSVFHHLVHGQGVQEVVALIKRVAECADIGIFEFALDSEPVYWASSLPSDPRELLVSYAFTRALSNFPTHLSSVTRPLFFCSNAYWYADNSVERFLECKLEPHPFAQGVHGMSRRYFLSQEAILKQFSKARDDGLDINVRELENEYQFLSRHARAATYPRLRSYEEDEHDIFLVRDLVEGGLLSDALERGQILDKHELTLSILDQVVALESEGLYHNDLRSWNILVTKDGRAAIIDFGSITTDDRDCSWPNDIHLAFLTLVREIFDGVVARPSPVRPVLAVTESLPLALQETFSTFFARRMPERTFAKLKCIIDEVVDEGGSQIISFDDAWNQWARAIEALVRISNREIEVREDRAKVADARAGAAEARTVEAEACSARAEERTAEAERRASEAEARAMLRDSCAEEAIAYSKDLEVRVVEADLAATELAEVLKRAENKVQELQGQFTKLDAELQRWRMQPFRFLVANWKNLFKGL